MFAPHDGFICGVKTCSLNTSKSYVEIPNMTMFFSPFFKAACDYVRYNQYSVKLLVYLIGFLTLLRLNIKDIGRNIN